MDYKSKYHLFSDLSFVQYQFVDFFADDHLSTLMFLDQNRKQLDYHFVIWKFDTAKLDQATLHKLDVGVANVNNVEDDEE